MKKSIAQFFEPPTAKELAQRELEQAQRELLRAQSAAEYADALVVYNEARIARLQSALAAQ